MVDESPQFVNEIVPEEIRVQFDTIFYADTVDVNCDGSFDILLYAQRAAREATPGRQVLGIFRLKGGRWDGLLMKDGVVDGVEQLVLVADLSGDRQLDLVTMAADEGGYIPRVFKAVGDTGYVEIRVPLVYTIRHEAEWSSTCLAKVNPRVVGAGRMSLLRETISPGADRGHGDQCDLPRDTVRIVGDQIGPAR